MSDFDLYKYKSKADKKWVKRWREGIRNTIVLSYKGGRGKCQEILLEKEIQVYIMSFLFKIFRGKFSRYIIND